MKRIAFKMFLKPGMEREYERRHNEIWPELKQLLSLQGVSDYTIFLDPATNVLFACQKSESNTGSQKQDDGGIIQKWWDYMADIMDTNPDNSPISHFLVEIFHMD